MKGVYLQQDREFIASLGSWIFHSNKGGFDAVLKQENKIHALTVHAQLPNIEINRSK